MTSKRTVRRGRAALALAVLGWLPILAYALQRWNDPAGMAGSAGSFLFLLYAMPGAIFQMCALFFSTLARGTKTSLVAIALALPALILLGCSAALLLVG